MPPAAPSVPLAPLLRLVTTRPQLVADHAQAYGALALVACQAASAGWQRRMLMTALALSSLVVASVLAGTAGLLWLALPAGVLPWPGGWLAIPLLPLLAALAFGWAARTTPEDSAGWALVRQQWHEDQQLLRDAAAGATR